MISIINIHQLQNNYSYLIKSSNKVIIVDPSEANPIIRFIKKNKLVIKAILLTHHHADHTAGVKDIIRHTNVPVYSPNQNIEGTTKVLQHDDIINLEFINFEVIGTPGHTLDHIVFYSRKNNLLFSGDTLFRLGCGRVFEGTYEQMYKSLIKIYSLSNDTMVYCGHEYTSANLNFLASVFIEYEGLKDELVKIKGQIAKTNSSIPFNLGNEKLINPFLSSESEFYKEFKKQKKLSNIGMFSYLRDLKNNFS